MSFSSSKEDLRRAPAGLAAVALALTLVAMLVGASAASAAPKQIGGFIGGTTAGLSSGAGVLAGYGGGSFGGIGDVAVYTGNDADPANDALLVLERDGNNNRVQRLDADGGFELMWGSDVVAAGAPGDSGIAYEVCAVAADCKAAPAGTGAGELSSPQGLAVDQASGHVFVLDRDNYRVQEFTLDGAFVRAWGWGVATGAAEFEVCTVDCQRGIPGAGDGQLGESFADGQGIAVDPVNGDVFVADHGNRRVEQFSASGAFLGAFGSAGSGVGEFGSDGPLHVAVDSSHVVYLSDGDRSGNDLEESDRVQRYDSQADAFLAPIACCDPAPGAPLVAGRTRGLEIDPDGDGGGPDEEHLLVARYAREPFTTDTVVQELDLPTPATDPVTALVETHAYQTDPLAPNRNIDRDVQGIAVNATTGYIYLAGNAFGPLTSSGTFTGCSGNVCTGLFVLSADAAGPLDAAVTGANASTTSAVVDGSANAGGGVSSYRFEVSTDGVTWTDSGASGYVSGLADKPVAGQLAGLQPNSFYRVRLVVRKQTAWTAQESATSNELVVLTDAAAPDVETLGSSQRTDRSAQLRARVDPNGADTAYRFEYGPAGGSFDQRVPVPDGSAGSGNAPRLVVADVAGLQPSTAYHYRIVATNFAGTSVGDPVSFTTDATEPSSAPIGRGLELVSPPDKVGGVGVGTWYNAPTAVGHLGTAAHEGERFALEGALGSVLVDGAFTYSNDWALAERTPQGWVSTPAASRRSHTIQYFADLTVNAAAEDLSLTSWGSGGHTITLFPEMASWDENLVGKRSPGARLERGALGAGRPDRPRPASRWRGPSGGRTQGDRCRRLRSGGIGGRHPWARRSR